MVIVDDHDDAECRMMNIYHSIILLKYMLTEAVGAVAGTVIVMGIHHLPLLGHPLVLRRAAVQLVGVLGVDAVVIPTGPHRACLVERVDPVEVRHICSCSVVA